MDFTPDPRTQELVASLQEMMREHVVPAQRRFEEELTPPATGGRGRASRSCRSCGTRRGAAGCGTPSCPARRGRGLTNLQYAALAEVTGHAMDPRPRRPQLRRAGHRQHGGAAQFGTPEQKEQWLQLQPLLRGEIRSAFAMTEPDVASSDATNISTSIRRDGDDYVVNGRKWWITAR